MKPAARSWRRAAPGVLLALLASGGIASAAGLPPAGSYTYFSRSQCIGAGKFSSEICRNAEINSRAEFEEKMPAYSTRPACERTHGRGRCNIVSATTAECKGGAKGICFMARTGGFRIVVRSSSTADVIPLGARGPLAFAPRSALRKMASRSRRTQALVQQRMGAAGPPSANWVDAPAPGRTAVPRAPVDPNFDCSLVVETRPGEDPNSFCYPARQR